MRPLTFGKKLITGFVAAMSLLVFLSAISYHTITSLERADNWVSHTLQVIVNTQRISAELTEAYYNKQLHAGTNDEIIIKNYNTVKFPIRKNIDSLRWLVRDNPPQVRKIDSLVKYVNNELNGKTVIAVSLP